MNAVRAAVAAQRLRASPLELPVTAPADRMSELQPVNRAARRRCGRHARKCPADAGQWLIGALCGPCVPLVIMAVVPGLPCRA